MSLDDLPRLSDEDRTALDDGYVAINGVPIGDPPADSPNSAPDRIDARPAARDGIKAGMFPAGNARMCRFEVNQITEEASDEQKD